MRQNGLMMNAELCYRIVQTRDRRYDGVFYVGVASTGIYCRPSCPARTPAPAQVRFYQTAAAAQAAGYRACKRCRPDATPGSPDWNVRADAAGRAMRLILDGVVDREGIEGLARRVGYSPRQLHRVLLGELGAGPLSLARAQRLHTARVLLQTTRLPMAQVAFAAGFTSIRQFNATVRSVFAQTPTELRQRKERWSEAGPESTVRLRLAYRPPLDFEYALRFLRERAVPGVEAVEDGVYMRVLDLPHGLGVAKVRRPAEDATYLSCDLRLGDIRDLPAATERVRRLFDLDADPQGIGETLLRDPVLGALVRARPGLRALGAVDGHEMAMRAVLGQQVSVRGARTLAGRLARMHGEPLAQPQGPLTHAFPYAARIAELDPATLAIPRARALALVGLAAALASGTVQLDQGSDRDDVTRQLLALRGIGPWTAAYIRMRALGDTDAFLPSDLGVRKALRQMGYEGACEELSEGWRPWRTYAVHHLWASLESPVPSHGEEMTPR